MVIWTYIMHIRTDRVHKRYLKIWEDGLIDRFPCFLRNAHRANVEFNGAKYLCFYLFTVISLLSPFQGFPRVLGGLHFPIHSPGPPFQLLQSDAFLEPASCLSFSASPGPFTLFHLAYFSHLKHEKARDPERPAGCEPGVTHVIIFRRMVMVGFMVSGY